MHKINKYNITSRLLLFAIVCSIAFSTAFIENTNAKVNSPLINHTERGKKLGADLTGAWYYTALVDENGKVTEMANRESWLELKKNGDYEQRVFTGTLTGTYSVAGDRLTLRPENSDPRVYTIVFGAGGNTLTLKAANGSAYKLER
jgi:hypothetical protein